MKRKEKIMETINDIIYELNGDAKTKALAKRIELAKINDEQRWRKDIADTRRLTAKRMMENIELTEKARCTDCIKQAVISCNQQKMREALLMVKNLFDGQIMFQNAIREAHKAVNDALAAPSRNCDLYKSEPEAYQAYITAMKHATEKTYVYFEPWLFEIVKGV